ncbi:MAG: hypothetical protein HY706_15960 [Candidatus Hydrogenedentes bacterium]|nr:hypothetical protein [Candidatus Hydrogenedentota bacterium]
MKRETGDTLLTIEHRSGYTIFRHADIALERVLDRLGSRGQILKSSVRSETRRVENWVIKIGRGGGILGLVKRTLVRVRCRRGWHAANFLHARGIGVPQPYAYVEVRCLGFIVRNAFLCEYLDDCCTVEQYAARLMERAASDGEVRAFLSGLAAAIKDLEKVGAHHSDLSGKNIFTRDGRSFYFIDLDAMTLNRRHTDAMRMRNHVQLYDSFCDLWDDQILQPFLVQLLPAGKDGETWMKTVRANQARRRARAVGIWKKQGRSASQQP